MQSLWFVWDVSLNFYLSKRVVYCKKTCNFTKFFCILQILHVKRKITEKNTDLHFHFTGKTLYFTVYFWPPAATRTYPIFLTIFFFYNFFLKYGQKL